MRGILIPVEGQHDPREVAHLVDRMLARRASRSTAPRAPFEIEEKAYAAGTFVIPMSQVFARYAKDLLEPQTYPEVRRTTDSAPEPPYDVTRVVARHAARRRPSSSSAFRCRRR